MLTRCPACGTTFRVTAEQLRQRGGRVRCGQCQQAFSALEQLIDESMPGVPGAPVPPPHATDARDDAIDMPPAATDAVPPAPTFMPAAAAVDDPTDDSLAVFPTPPTSDIAAEPNQSAAAETSPAQGAPSTVKKSADPLLDGFSDWPEDVTATRPIRRWPWLLGSLVLLAILLIQAAIAFRVELAVLSPATKPALLALCRMAGCTVDLPAKTELIGIAASDLHPDPGQPGRLFFSATIENRAPFNQAFPHLELTLTDVADKPVMRKVLPPASYLPPKTDRATGMPASGEVSISLVLDIGQAQANGYRLYLFYP